MASKSRGVREKAEIIFNKRYKLKSKHDMYTLPEAELMFSTPPFAVEALTAIKNGLNATKNLLNLKDIEKWRRHTGKTNPCGLVVKHLREVIKPELCTQAWVKFYEILCSCNITPNTCKENATSLHLCEAPGAFIASLNHYIKCNYENMNWKWLASTLNPFYEGNDTKRMISGERFIIDTLAQWNFGESVDGDLMQWKNLECLVQALGGAGKADIVTADGSISCADDPDKQEIVIGQLLYCEVVAAIVNLAYGGSMVIKMFTMFEYHTIGILYLLCCLFQEVEIIKPGTSKPGNSEVYCVCTSFLGSEYLSKDVLEKLKTHYTPILFEQALFPYERLPSKFIEKVIDCAKTFSEYQTSAITRNIELFEHPSKGKWKFLNRLRRFLAEEFVCRFNIQCLDQDLLVVPNVYLDGTQLSYWPEGVNDTYCNSGTHETGSYIDRVAMSKLGWHERVVTPQDGMCYVISQDEILNEISLSVKSNLRIEWLKGSEILPSDEMPDSYIQLGKPIDVIQSSRFCPATLISQLKEAKENAKIFLTNDGRELIKSLELLAEEKLGQDSSGLNILSVLKRSGLLRNASRPSFAIDISGNGRFISELLNHGVLYPEKCTALLCEKCAVQSSDTENVFVKSCLSYDGDEIEKLKRFGLEQLTNDNTEPRCDSDDSENTRVYQTSVTSRKNVEANDKSFRVILGTVFNECKVKEQCNYDEICSKSSLLNQCVTALSLLQNGDSFVCELSDTLTQFTVGIIYILHLLFKEIVLMTPVFSPTSKQFIVCREFVNTNHSTSLLAYLENVLEVWTSKPAGKDIIGFLPIKELFSKKFYQYIRKHSTNHTRQQLNWIVKCERLLLSKK